MATFEKILFPHADLAEVGIGVEPRIVDKSTEFLERLEAGLSLALQDMVEDGETLSFNLAPTGHKPDRRTVPLRAGFFHHIDGHRGYWGNFARHALPIERGAKAHGITPDVKFYWEKEARWWKGGARYPGQKIKHPGNAAQPFLKPAFDVIWADRNKYLRHHLGRNV